MPWCARARALTKCSTGIPSPLDRLSREGARMRRGERSNASGTPSRGSFGARGWPWRSNLHPRLLAARLCGGAIWAALAFGLAETASRREVLVFFAPWACSAPGCFSAASAPPLAEPGGGAGAGRRAPAGAAAGGFARHAGDRARRSRRAAGLGRAPGADAPAGGRGAGGAGGPAARQPRPLGDPAGGAGGAHCGADLRPRPRRRSVTAALAPAGDPTVAAGPSFEGWAEPPAYTGRPTLYLPEVPAGAPVSVPQGTTVTLRAYGGAEGSSLPRPSRARPRPQPSTRRRPVSPSPLPGGGGGRGGIAPRRRHARRVVLPGRARPRAGDRGDHAARAGADRRGPARLRCAGRPRGGGGAGDIALDLAAVDRRLGLATEPEALPTSWSSCRCR